jgi:hypothetical protein
MKAMNLPTPQVLALLAVAKTHLARRLFHAPIRLTPSGPLFGNRAGQPSHPP